MTRFRNGQEEQSGTIRRDKKFHCLPVPAGRSPAMTTPFPIDCYREGVEQIAQSVFETMLGVSMDWLGDVAVHAGGEASLTVARYGMSRHGNDRNMPSRAALFRPDGGSGLEPVRLR